MAQRDQIREMSGRKSPRIRPVWRPFQKVWFAETGWWWRQSCSNRSPTQEQGIFPKFQSKTGFQIALKCWALKFPPGFKAVRRPASNLSGITHNKRLQRDSKL